MSFRFVEALGWVVAALFVLAALALVLLTSCATVARTGSAYRSSGPCPTHVGLRPHADSTRDVALTIQISADPECRR